jgi:hypothetical protein
MNVLNVTIESLWNTNKGKLPGNMRDAMNPSSSKGTVHDYSMGFLSSSL